MGGGASKKKPEAQEEKPPVWVDNLDGTTFGDDGTTYTGLTRMGLVRLKPHLVGRLTYSNGETGSQEGDGLDDDVTEIGGDAAEAEGGETKQGEPDGDMKSVGHGTLKSEKTQRTEQTKFTRAPSEKSTNSRWSTVKGSLKDLKQAPQITRAPSDKSSNSRWSLVKDQVSQRTISEKGGGASLAGKTNQTGEFRRVPSNPSQAFGRVPSNASQAKSRWSDVKSRLSAGSLGTAIKVEEKITDYVYIGEFLEGKKHGLGIQTHVDGKMYAGEWQEGQMHGWGVLIRKDGSVYRGQFEQGKIRGSGAEIVVSPVQDKGYQQGDPTRLFLSFQGRWENDRREGKGVAGRARCANGSEVLGLVQVDVVTYNKGVLKPTESVPLKDNKTKWSSLLSAQMDSWMQASLAEKKADKLQSLVQKLLLDKADEIMADTETQMSDEALTEEMIKLWGQVKDLLTAEGDQDYRTEIQESWKSCESAQYDAEMAAVQLAKEREEAEERARQLEIERLEALKRLKKAQEQMADAKATQHDAMMKMKEAKNLKHRAQQARDEKKLLEMQLGSLKEEAVKCGKALQELEEKEQDARQAFDEVALDVQEAAKQLTLCEAKLKTAERSVQRLTQEYEVGHDQLRVQAANCLTFHQVKEVFEKHDADGSGELEWEEIKLALQDLGLPSHGKAVDQFILQLDTDCTGTLDWPEFQQLARKSEETKGAEGQLLKHASEAEKELQEAMNTAVGSLIAQSNNFVAAQLKVKSSELAQAEKQKTLEEAAAKLLQTQLADELATMNQSSAELRIKQLVGHIHSLEELAVQTTNEATEAAAKGSLKWQEATAALEAAEQGEKEVADQYADEAARQAALAEARERALAELDEAEEDAVQVTQASDAARIAWMDAYLSPPDGESAQPKANGVDYVYPDRKAKYRGEWRNGKRWGQGKLTLYRSALPPKATVLFAGEQVPTEPGGLCLGEKATYEGLWVNDVPDGLGVMIDPMQGRYQGAWKRGVRQGNGMFIDAQRNTYQGKWQGNSKNGPGVETMANGEKYEGEFQDGLRHGNKAVTVRGETYKHSGAWRRGKMHGKGTVNDDGVNYVGDFRNGEQTGKAHIMYNDFLEYKGEVLKGVRQGNGVMLFEDDRRYQGEWVMDEMQGYGVMTYVNGNEYNGHFEAGKRHGPKGSLEIKDLEGCEARYIGDFHHDRMEGKGVVEWTDGRKYEGHLQDGIRYGEGVMTYADGSTYNGNWLNGVQSGMGTLIFADGSKYTGFFQNNQRHGRGTMEMCNGEKCSGEWRDDKMHGKGTFTYIDGSTYEGEFAHGAMCGRGEYKNENGRTYVGEWLNNVREGSGEEIDESGRKFVGRFHNNLMHGTGIWKWPSGRFYEGMWERGQKHGWGKERIPTDIWGKQWTEYEGEFKMGEEKIGKGRFVCENGDVYDGYWRDKLRHGHGRFEQMDGYLYEGSWVDDKKSGIGRERLTNGVNYQGEFYNNERHGAGTEISQNGDQYIGEYFKGVRSGEGKSFKNSTSSRYEGEFVQDLPHGKGTKVHREIVDGKSTWITYEGLWHEGTKHGEGRETDVSDLTETKVAYFMDHKKEFDAPVIFRNPSIALSETTTDDRDTLHDIINNLRRTRRDLEEREEWIWRLERSLRDDNPKCSTFRQQMLEHGGVPVICELLTDDTDDMAQLKGGQFLYFMSQTVDFSGMAAAVVECHGAVGHIVALLHEENSEPRIYSCGILQALCKDKDFARLAVGAGAATTLVSLLKQPGWITLKGKGLAALALRNIGLHQRAIVSVELGLPVATGGVGYDSKKNASEMQNMEEAIRKILIATSAGPAAMML